MNRRLTIACLTILLACAAPASQAQISTRAYAPENLSQLSTPDRSRVIAQEYADQSNGRRIPDDQLRFYLAQVNSGWGFSRIKQDIATSLRGSGNGGGWNGGGGGWNGGGGSHTSVVRCESQKNRNQTCNTGWRSARLSRQISGTQCVEGRNWGSRNGTVWVSGGCRAEFVEGRGNSGGGWGGGNSNYSVTCSSNNNRQQTCAWEARRGRPVLLQQLSGSACMEGRSWGYTNGSLWVSNGCRARFGVR
ncbi:DUF3011 domain-containing protein [Stenotrophomonas rhizophila]|uniref:DUF3011 domain-containing protein n=1 Tax=Stenotrophomonas rhizophila TaxID=216778 RepID=UPI001E432E13|nr:DUF3011 domain-containing protein [Stenotrophomonas rhizophila]MCC7632532.1 DUF3011 domain-containing protein [Stenotrophomonas rhizophila]MCC7663384.1 DUF3011 domain-containing protein [Stenotrophomonas rhizophila]